MAQGMTKGEAKQRRRYEIAMGLAALYKNEFAVRQAVLENAIKKVAQLMGGKITPMDIVMYASRLQQDDQSLAAEQACELAIGNIEEGKVDADDLFENRLAMMGIEAERAETLRQARALAERGIVLPGSSEA